MRSLLWTLCLAVCPVTLHAQSFAYDVKLDAIEAQRVELSAAYKRADGPGRAKIRRQARALVVSLIDTVIFPSWMGMPWGLGKNSTAKRPFAPGKVVGCSYFVTSVLQNAGLKLSNRYHYAQAAALHIQRSLAPRKQDLHRFLSLPADKLTRGVAKLGDGLYIIGLNNHVGFVRVRAGDVRFIHASYTDDQVVVDEPFESAKAIINSRKAGYFLSPIFQDDRLVEHWLLGRAVPFTGPR